MTHEQIIGITLAAFMVGVLIGCFAMDKLHGKTGKVKPTKGNINLN